MKMDVNIAVVISYFLLIGGIGFAFRKMGSKSSSDFFRGGGRMLWWMAGATAFMSQFSAWTFTGAAGEAFKHGFPIAYIFLANTLAYFVGYLYFAQRFRQMRVDTATEAIRGRFGIANEHFFTWAIIPLSIISGGVWLNGLAVFASAMFHINLTLTLWITGLVVLFLSMLAGAWGVAASDFVQALVVAVISVACAIVALVAVGGPSVILTRFPSGFFVGPDMHYTGLLVGFAIFFLVKQLQSCNNYLDSYRFLCAKDSRNARNASLFAGVLMLMGTLIWFIPPWASAILYPDAVAQYAPSLGKKASDAVYLVFAERAMPVGAVGLLMAGLFSATMSSMDGALNRNAGIFVRSFYVPLFCKGERSPEQEKKILQMGRVVNVVNGILVILVAQFFAELKGLSLFELMMRVGTLAQAPILVPVFFGIFIRKTPDWAAWATVLFGLVVSWFFGYLCTAKEISEWMGYALTHREISGANTMLAIAAHLFITGSFFISTRLFYREPKGERAVEKAQFFKNVDTPVMSDGEEQDAVDNAQRTKLGIITMVMGCGLLIMTIIPNPLWGRLLFLGCAVVILLIGYMMHHSGKPVIKQA